MFEFRFSLQRNKEPSRHGAAFEAKWMYSDGSYPWRNHQAELRLGAGSQFLSSQFYVTVDMNLKDYATPIVYAARSRSSNKKENDKS